MLVKLLQSLLYLSLCSICVEGEGTPYEVATNFKVKELIREHLLKSFAEVALFMMGRVYNGFIRHVKRACQLEYLL